MLDLEEDNDEDNADAGLLIAAAGDEQPELRVPRRKLYAFSSLEVTLLDEDKPDKDDEQKPIEY